MFERSFSSVRARNQITKATKQPTLPHYSSTTSKQLLHLLLLNSQQPLHQQITFKMQFSINALISLTMVLATSVEAKKGLHGKGFTGDGVLGAGAQFLGGVVGGAIGRRGIHERRQTDPLDSVPQYNYDMCHESLSGAKLSFTPAGPGSFQVAGVPSTCMVLATVLTGSYNAGYPVPLGADSLRFSGLTDDELHQLQSYFH
ncbi:hypothetical protein E4T52_02326 [Aureobasidium sp. EXF-3400]|nr:hypothetical protein E4T52_02326 [Aureobasidium sp. EXF-3400]